MSTFSAAAYWDARYRKGGFSGAGSRGEEAVQKVAYIQHIITTYRVRSVLDLGCGDGAIAAELRVPTYIGHDVSPTAVNACKALMPYHQFTTELPPESVTFDMTMSVDVMFHLVDPEDFRAHRAALFSRSHKLVLIYATDHDERGAPHVLHRAWTRDWAPPEGWTLLWSEEVPADRRKRVSLYGRGSA